MTITHAITRDAILEQARSLPAAPQVMAGLSELLQDINTDLDQIADAVRMDPALAARVIRISNSVVFGGDERVGSIEDAVNRVGFDEVLRIVGVATVSGLADRALSCYALTAERVRESSLLHALAAESIASYAGIEPHTAYSAGLLRSIGMMVIERIARQTLTPAEYFDPTQFVSYAEWETARFGVTAMDVATMVFDEWRFPPEVVSAVQKHLLLADEHYQDRFACVLNIAGGIVNVAGLALPGESTAWEFVTEKLSWANLDEAQFERAQSRALNQFEQQRAALY